MSERLDRIEQKLDKLLDLRTEEHARLTKLETQAGFVKWIAATCLTITLFVASKFWKVP